MSTNSLLEQILASLGGTDIALNKCVAWASLDGNQQVAVLWPTDRDLYVQAIELHSLNGNDPIYWGVYDCSPEPSWDVTYGSNSGFKSYTEIYDTPPGLLNNTTVHANFKKGAIYPAGDSLTSQAIMGTRHTPYNAPYHPHIRLVNPIRLAAGQQQGFFVRRLNNASFIVTIWFVEVEDAPGLLPAITTASPWE